MNTESMSQERIDFYKMLEIKYPSLYADRAMLGIRDWVEVMFQCYLQGCSDMVTKVQERLK